MRHANANRYAVQEYEMGRRETLGPDVVDWTLLFPPGGASVKNTKEGAFLWRLERISAVLNSEGGDPPEQPSSNPLASLRTYFLPYTKRVCELQERVGDAVVADFTELLRTTPRIPLVGWYPVDTGQREVIDTNFGEGYDVPVQSAGNCWPLLIASQKPAAVTESFATTLHWARYFVPDMHWEN